ncbi:hypothetical protein [Planotetraspora sp. GP83]|uniref:hypothetical protein n=1 Tax=Planotetraspora sp. GP83 TaxID=3156264 RepID=UPI003513ABAF
MRPRPPGRIGLPTHHRRRLAASTLGRLRARLDGDALDRATYGYRAVPRRVAGFVGYVDTRGWSRRRSQRTICPLV